MSKMSQMSQISVYQAPVDTQNVGATLAVARLALARFATLALIRPALARFPLAPTNTATPFIYPRAHQACPRQIPSSQSKLDRRQRRQLCHRGQLSQPSQMHFCHEQSLRRPIHTPTRPPNKAAHFDTHLKQITIRPPNNLQDLAQSFPPKTCREIAYLARHSRIFAAH